MSYTLRIVKLGAADLDGSTPLDLTAAGVLIDRTLGGTITVTVPDGVALGTIDPGEVLEAAGETGNTYILLQATAVSAAVYSGGTTNNIQRVVGVTSEELADLTATNGAALNGKILFQPDVLIAVNTDVGGPHELNIHIKRLTDDDLTISALGISGTTPATDAASFQDKFAFDGDNGTTILPSIFGTWLETFSAIDTLVPQNASGIRVPYDLYINDPPDIEGTFNLNGANLDVFDNIQGSIISFSNAIELQDVRSFKNLRLSATGASPPFTYTSDVLDITFTHVNTLGGGTPLFQVPASGVLLSLIDCIFDDDSITIEGGSGAFAVNIFNNTTFRANAIDSTLSASNVVLRINGAKTDVSLTQGATVNLDLGTEGLTLSGGSEIIFSAGDTDLAALSGSRAEAYVGGNFAAPVATWAVAPSPTGTATQTSPFRGLVVSRGLLYMKGISLTIPLPDGTGGDTVDIEIYVNGVLIITSTFDPTVQYQFDDTGGFGRAEKGDVIECFVAPTSITGQASWTDGFMVSVQAV